MVAEDLGLLIACVNIGFVGGGAFVSLKRSVIGVGGAPVHVDVVVVALTRFQTSSNPGGIDRINLYML